MGNTILTTQDASAGGRKAPSAKPHSARVTFSNPSAIAHGRRSNFPLQQRLHTPPVESTTKCQGFSAQLEHGMHSICAAVRLHAADILRQAYQLPTYSNADLTLRPRMSECKVCMDVSTATILAPRNILLREAQRGALRLPAQFGQLRRRSLRCASCSKVKRQRCRTSNGVRGSAQDMATID